MKQKHSFGTRLVAWLLSIMMVLSLMPVAPVSADMEPEAMIGETEYEFLEQAVAAVSVGTDEATTITLLNNASLSFDVGTEDGSAPKNIILDLNGKVLTLDKAVGSTGTRSSGIRVLAGSKLTVKNGQIICPDDAVYNIKVGIANYGTLVLDSVVLTPGALTMYGVNNRGNLTLKGNTQIPDYNGGLFQFGITNDPYVAYYNAFDAAVNCASTAVAVGSMQVERYARTTANAGGVVLNISGGTFGKIVEDGATAVDVDYQLAGGDIGVTTGTQLESLVKNAPNGSVIKLADDVTLGFDVGVENGTVSRNLTVDLNGKTLTTAPSVGSTGTKTSGIRVLANSSLTLKNGKVVSPDAAEGVNVKVGLANYGKLDLQNVEVVAGNAIIYTINNRGELTLSGATNVGNGSGDKFQFAITNDPYEFIYTDRDAVLNVHDAAVVVGKMQVERYERKTTNAGGIVLNISAGTFGELVDDKGTFVDVTGNITGGAFANDIAAYASQGYQVVQNQNGVYEVEKIKVEQDALIFEGGNYAELTYMEGLTFQIPKVSGGSAGKPVVYEVVRGDNAQVNAETGEVTFLKTGTCVIRATMPGNADYKDVSADFTVKVVQGNREAAFERNFDSVYYGTVSLACPALLVSAGGGMIAYEVVEGADIADVDVDGNLTFKDGGLGTVKVRATVAADENYNACTAEYTVKVEYLPVPENALQFISRNQGENGWYRSDVLLAAPGYTLSENNNINDAWMESISCADEGVTTKKVHLKNEQGYITDAIDVEVKIDRLVPANLEIEYLKHGWTDALKNIFGGNSTVTMIFHFEENGSGPDRVAYSLDGGVTFLDAVLNEDGQYTATVDPEYRGHVQFFVVDKAGWCAKVLEDGSLLIVDKIAPNITLSKEGENYYEEIVTDDEGTNTTVITTADGPENPFKLIFTVTDENFDVVDGEFELTINGQVADVAWEAVSVDGKCGQTAELELKDEGSYKVRLKGTDRSNEDVKEWLVIVDRTDPVLHVDTVTEPNKTENKLSYYNAAEFQLVMVVDELYFSDQRVSYTIERNGELLDLADAANQGIVLEESWNETADGHKKLVSFGENAQEGRYTLRVAYTVGGGDKTETRWSEPLEVVVDRTNPNATISYAEEGGLFQVAKWLFGKEKVDVTIHVKDGVAGVDTLTYNIGDGVEHNAELNGDTYTFSIEEQYRNQVSAKVVDKAGNEMTITSSETLVIDKNEAEFSVGFRGAATFTQGTARFTTADPTFKLIFQVKHENFDIHASAPVVEYKAAGSNSDWVKVPADLVTVKMVEGQEYQGTITVAMPSQIIGVEGADAKEGEYEFRCTYSLFDGWTYSTSCIAVVDYDKVSPALNFACDADAVKTEVVGKETLQYFHDDLSVAIQVTERHFDKNNVNLKVEYKSSKDGEYADWKGLTNCIWIHGENNKHTLSMPFAADGYYRVTMICADTVLPNATSNIAQIFVVDKTNPVISEITYTDEFEWYEILGQWFGFPIADENKEVKATWNVSDAVTGVKNVTYSIDGKNFNKLAVNEEGEYSLVMGEGFRNMLTICAVDGANREEKHAEQGAIVVDTLNPEVTAEHPEGNVYQDTAPNIIYTKLDKFEISFVVEDSNFDLRGDDCVKVNINNKPAELMWSQIAEDNLEGVSAPVALTEEGVYSIVASFTDRSQNEGLWTKTVVVDRTNPLVNVTLDDGAIQNEKDDIRYYRTAQTVTVTVEETNFLAEQVSLELIGAQVLDDNGEAIDFDAYAKNPANWTTVGDKHTLKSFELKTDAEYSLTVSCEDKAGNVGGFDSGKFVVDQTAPDAPTIIYDASAVNVVKKIVEELTLGFFKAPVVVTIAAEDATAGIKNIAYKAEGYTGTSNQTDENKVILEDVLEPVNGKISFEIDKAFYGTITASATDYANNNSEDTAVGCDKDGKKLHEIVVDSTETTCTITLSPANATQEVEIEEQTVYFYNGDVTATIELIEDNFYSENYQVKVNNVVQENIVWDSVGNKHTAKVEMVEDGDYIISVTGADYSGNVIEGICTTQRIVVDKTAPVIEIAYFELVEKDGEMVETEIPADQLPEKPRDKAVYARLMITEHNFRAEDVEVLVTAKDAAGADVLDLDETYFNQGRIQNGEGETDESKWSAYESQWRRENDTYVTELVFNMDARYTFRMKYADLAKNEAETEEAAFIVDNKDPIMVVEGIVDGAFYNDAEGKVVTIRIQEDNFDPAGVEFTCIGVDANGETVPFVLPNLKALGFWTSDETKTIWTAEVKLSQDANYSMTLAYTDPSGRTGKVLLTNEEQFVADFTLDRVAPQNVAISYNNCVQEKDGVRYYDNAARVTLTATDLTAAKMTFKITLSSDAGFAAATDYASVPGELEISYDTDIDKLNEKLTTAGVKLQAYRSLNNGTMTVDLVFHKQFRGDVAFEVVDKANNSPEEACTDVFQIAVDTISPTRTVELPDANLVEDGTLRRYYHDSAVTVNFTVKEANFYNADPVFTVNENIVTLDWKHDKRNEVHTASYTMTDEGDYVLGLTYTDRSGRVMEAYTSEVITIDRTKPDIKVEYDLNDAVSIHEGRAYYAAVRTATITVMERNFVAEDIKYDITAKNVSGTDVAGPVFGTWVSDGDKHTLTLTYSGDANYTFDMAYTDRAGNAAADYAGDTFTVDQTVPARVKISYSTHVWQEFLNDLTFGFYDAKVQVTLRSSDATAGVESFNYSYVNAPNVSGVNSGLTNQTVAATTSGDGSAVATFYIPKSALTNGTQFNGTVTATATDRSGNESESFTDKTRIVVDNISPNATITYNDPVRVVNGTAYYADQINATIRINEANFYSKDVQVSVIRDGVASRVTPRWNDQSVDLHVGTFTLDTEGDYIVEVRYVDKSGNDMIPYTSGKMIIDQEKPTIHVSNVVANSANKDEVYTFAITVDDADGNMALADIQPVLSAVVQDENGNYVSRDIELPDATVTAVGKTYIYTVENLELDAIYTLKCTASDLAGNTTNLMVLDDGTALDVVRFSINRNGSTFSYGMEETAYLASDYYVKNVNNDIVIHEVNVDPISEYHVILNGVELQEGDGFATNIIGGDDRWCLREYVIPASHFADEGEYNIVISSVDATESVAYSDLKGLRMSFVVDRTAPSVVVGGLEDGGRYESEEQIVKIVPSDEGGRLAKVEIRLYEDGANVETAAPIQILFSMEGEALLDYLDQHNGEIEVKVPEGYQQSVVIVCEDMATGTETEANVYTKTIRNVTVSSNPWIIFLANKTALYSTIGGLIALISAIIFFLLKRKKKDEEKKA